MTTALIFSADHHINSTVALCPPEVVLDEGSYTASRGQRWLWECWLDAWKQVQALTVDCSETVGVFVGDLGDLDAKRRSNQIISPSKAVILRMIADTMQPALINLDRWYIVRGTMAHEGKSCWLEEAVAKDISATGGEAEGRFSWWHLRGTLADLRLDVAHHASMGWLPWTEKNAALKIAAVAAIKYWQRGLPAPNLIVRAHNHRYSDSGDNYDGIHAVTLPCWSLITEFAYRLGRENDRPDIGLIVFIISENKWTKHILRYTPDEKRTWTRKL
jgi:hypothetical protein